MIINFQTLWCDAVQYQLSKPFFVLFLLPAEAHRDTYIFFYLYICFSVVSSCYTLIWDLKMDWGLFDRNAGENTFLREEIVYPHKVFLHIWGRRLKHCSTLSLNI